jgi:hypothetical protein
MENNKYQLVSLCLGVLRQMAMKEISHFAYVHLRYPALSKIEDCAYYSPISKFGRCVYDNQYSNSRNPRTE